MHHRPHAAILLGSIFGLLGVSCVGGSEKRSGSHDARDDRSSWLAGARTSAKGPTSHGPSQGATHQAAPGLSQDSSHGGVEHQRAVGELAEVGGAHGVTKEFAHAAAELASSH